MTSIVNYIKNLFNGECIIEMANLTSEDTNLEYPIWVQHQNYKECHWARLKVYPQGYQKGKGPYLSISIEGEPEIKIKKRNPKYKQKYINQVFDFIKRNQKLLLDYWNDSEIGTGELIRKLK